MHLRRKRPCPLPAKIGSQTIPVFITRTDFCDGVVHCPDAADENFELCKKAWTQTKGFGPTTYTCQSKYVGNNYTVQILAKKCNGIPECHLDEDEKYCQDTGRNLAIVLASCLVVFLVSSTLFLYHSKIQKIVGEVWFLDNSSDEELEVLVVNSHEVCQREQACRVLFERKLTKHNGQMGSAINDLKVNCITFGLLLCILPSFNFRTDWTLLLFIFWWILSCLKPSLVGHLTG